MLVIFPFILLVNEHFKNNFHWNIFIINKNPVYYQLFGLNFGFWRPPLCLWSEPQQRQPSPAQADQLPLLSTDNSCSLPLHTALPAVHSTQPPIFCCIFYETVKKWISLILPSTPPFPGLTVKCLMFPQCSPLAVKRVIKVTGFQHKRTLKTTIGGIWVISLLWHKNQPGPKETLHTSAFSVFQLTEKSGLARQHMMPSRAISRIITRSKKVNSLLWLSRNLTTPSGEEILLE
jgi:hypothetical protein